jgi:hypothetical protein
MLAGTKCACRAAVEAASWVPGDLPAAIFLPFDSSQFQVASPPGYRYSLVLGSSIKGNMLARCTF